MTVAIFEALFQAVGEWVRHRAAGRLGAAPFRTRAAAAAAAVLFALVLAAAGTGFVLLVASLAGATG